MDETRDPEPSLGRLEQTLMQDEIEPEEEKGQTEDREEEKEDLTGGAGDLYHNKNFYCLRFCNCF